MEPDNQSGDRCQNSLFQFTEINMYSTSPSIIIFKAQKRQICILKQQPQITHGQDINV